VVEFQSPTVSKELKGGSEGGTTALQFGSSRVEEGGSRQRTAWRRGQRGGGADGSRRWEPMEAGGGSRWRDENGPRAKEAAA
jgi:hypothetical protein